MFSPASCGLVLLADSGAERLALERNARHERRVAGTRVRFAEPPTVHVYEQTEPLDAAEPGAVCTGDDVPQWDEEDERLVALIMQAGANRERNKWIRPIESPLGQRAMAVSIR